jgi:hypothetical protein
MAMSRASGATLPLFILSAVLVAGCGFPSSPRGFTTYHFDPPRTRRALVNALLEAAPNWAVAKTEEEQDRIRKHAVEFADLRLGQFEDAALSLHIDGKCILHCSSEAIRRWREELGVATTAKDRGSFSRAGRLVPSAEALLLEFPATEFESAMRLRCKVQGDSLSCHSDVSPSGPGPAPIRLLWWRRE